MMAALLNLCATSVFDRSAALPSASENRYITYPIHGNITANTTPKIRIPKIVNTGINLLPEKNPSTAGISVPLNLL